MGIWDDAGATRSWLHSPSWSKSFALIKKKSQLNRNYLFGWYENRSEITMKHECETQKRLTLMSERVWCHEMVDPLLYDSPVFLSNFFSLSSTAFELSVSLLFCANADSGCVWFVGQNGRIPPQNGDLLLRIRALHGIIILSLPTILIHRSFFII